VLIQKVITYKGADGVPYIIKFSKEWLIANLEEKDEIKQIQYSFAGYSEKGVDVIDFTKIFLNILPHGEDETLYLTLSIIDLFKDICNSFDLKDLITASKVLDYIVEVSIQF